MNMNVLGLFSGIGGFELGLQRAGMNVSSYCEIEDHCLRVLRKNFPSATEWNDVRSITKKEDYDVICGGFPCFAKGTLVITSNGLSPIEDIKVGDMVLTHNNRFMPVVQTMDRMSDHSIRLKIMSSPDIITTDEHPFLCKKSKSSTIEWVNAKELDIGMYVALPNTPESTMVGSANFLSMPYLVGTLVGEFRTSTYKHSNHNKEVAYLLWAFGIGDKHCIPEWVFTMPYEWKKSFVEGYLDCSSDADIQFSTTSLSLSVSIARLLRDVYGSVATVTQSKKKSSKAFIGKSTFTIGIVYHIELTKSNADAFYDEGYWWVPIQNKEYESGIEVFNIGVQDDESYTANGVVCHNCQDISIAGKNAGLLTGEKSSLWREFKRVINDVRPKYTIIENVSALLGRGIEIVLQDLAEIGYDATWTLYDSKYFGVPQRRRRVYIIGVRDGIPSGTEIFDFSGRDKTDIEHRSKIASVNESFEWNFEQSGEGSEGFAYFTRQRSDEFAETGLASTLAKRDYKDFTDLIVSGDIIRRVDVSERLLLQGFPVDWWDGCDLTKTQKFMCNGMTVPVVQYIGEQLMRFDSLVNTKNL